MNTRSKVRVQASEKLKRQGFGRCTWTPHRHALGTTMNKRQESRKKNKPERGRPTELHRAVHPNTERENKNGHCTMRSPGEGSWQGRAAHANDGQVKVEVHEGHQVNIKLPEIKSKQRPGFPSQHPVWGAFHSPVAHWLAHIHLALCPVSALALFRRTEQAPSPGDQLQKIRLQG